MTGRARRFSPAGLFAVVALAAMAGCDPFTGPGDDDASILELPRPLTASEREVISASNDFGLELMRRVVEEELEEEGSRPNVVVSPLSASMALGMALNGAGGTTFDGMREALRFGNLSQSQINESYRGLLELLETLDPAVELSVANSAWANEDYPFHTSFFDTVTAYFDAEVRSLDFADPATLGAINGWVEDRTEGRIERILEELDPALALLLMNAVYFDGKWTTQFDPDDTRSRPFTRENGSTVTVEMMNMADVELPFGSTDELVAVELPYGGGAFSMVVAVPHGGTGRSVREILSEMDGADWEELLGSLQVRELDALSLPKFTVAYDAVLNDPLTAMGMGRAFTRNADFGRLSPERLCIDFVRQKTFIEVDEAGTKAAAVTAVGFGPVSFTGLVADRPFLFAIRERLSGTILFMGVVGDPTVEDSGPADMPGPCADRAFVG